MGVHEPRARRPDEAPRPDPDARQLERPVARAGRHAQRQRVADEGGHPVQLDLERGLRGRLRARRDPALARVRPDRPRPQPLPRDRRPDVRRRARGRPRARLRARRGARRTTRRSSASSTRAAWGCTTRSFPTSCCTRSGSSRSGSRSRCSTPPCSEVSDETARPHYDWLRAARHAVRARPGRGERADRAAGARGPEDVRRRRAHGARLRLRRDRDPVPAGPEGHLRRVGPRGGAAQQPGSSAGAPARRARRSSTASPCRTSTRWTSAPASTRC